MRRISLQAATALMVAGWSSVAAADTVCDGDILFQCTTDRPDFREQITVCAKDESYALTRHALSSGDMYYDPPLIADANTTWFRWTEGDRVQIEIGFWNTDLGEPVTVHVHLPWDDVSETARDDGTFDMWLQSPHWHGRVDQTLCRSDTVYAEPAALWPPQQERGPIGAFFSQDLVTPTSATVGIARIVEAQAIPEGLPVFAAARPNAATPIWWMLQPGDTVDIIDQRGAFIAVAIPTNGVAECILRPERLGLPYTGPCATGWVEGAFLEQIQ
ncbi:hypothetical protein [Phycobacter sp. K97]|uniref:hypothetical protein n=1 Tax=Phycobacter sedimenti TaxID=3133977 RepID=UPI00311DE1C6